MKFGFFKKNNDGKKKKNDLFDPTEDALDFDELEESGEFLSDESYSQPPGPAYQPPSPPPPLQPPVAPPAPPRPATPLPAAPSRPAPGRPAPGQPASKLPPAAPVRKPDRPAPPAPPLYDDLTVVNQPNVVLPPIPVPPVAPPPAAPPQAPPAAPPTAPIQATPPPPQLGDDDVTMVLNTPVGAESLVAWLVIASNPGRGQDFRLPRGMARIGTDAGCEINLSADTYLSSRHAEISFRNGQYYLRDLDSTNGTFVNDGPITEVALQDNDRIRLAQTTLIYKSLSL